MATKKSKKAKQNEYKNNWSKENRYIFSLCLYYKSDDELIQYLKQKPNKSEYLKNLIKQDLENNNK